MRGYAVEKKMYLQGTRTWNNKLQNFFFLAPSLYLAYKREKIDYGPDDGGDGGTRFALQVASFWAVLIPLIIWSQVYDSHELYYLFAV